MKKHQNLKEYGIIIDYNKAAYEFKETKEDNKESFFVKIEDPVSMQQSVIWGIDLERNIIENNLGKGDFIEIERKGNQKVTIPVSQTIEGEKIQTQKEVNKNIFEVKKFDKQLYLEQIVPDKKDKKETIPPLSKEKSKKKVENIITSDKQPGEANIAINGIRLSQKEVEALNNGNRIYLENMSINGMKRSGYIKNQNSHFIVDNLTDKFTVSDTILEKKLSADEHDKLKNGLPIAINSQNDNYLVQIDNSKNKVVIKADYSISMPQEIGNYKLTSSDKSFLENNQYMPPRVFLEKNTQSYFIANVKLTEDRKGLEFNGVNMLSQQEGKRLIQQYNQDHSSNKDISAVFNVGVSSLHTQKTVNPVIDTGIEEIKENKETVIDRVNNMAHKKKLSHLEFVSDESEVLDFSDPFKDSKNPDLLITENKIPPPSEQKIPVPREELKVDNSYDNAIER